MFNKPFFRKRESTFLPRFCTFDLLSLNGRDLRGLPLLERKRLLQKIVPKGPTRLHYMSHIDGEITRFFKMICSFDLEVADLRTGGMGRAPDTKSLHQTAECVGMNDKYGSGAVGPADHPTRSLEYLQNMLALYVF